METIKNKVNLGGKNKMKKFLVTAMFILGLGVNAVASNVNYTGNLINEQGLSYDKNYTLDCDAEGIDLLSMQAVYSTVTVPSMTFNDGIKSTGTITISSSNFTSAIATVNGSNYVQNYDWLAQDTASGTAKAIYNVISSTYSPLYLRKATGFIIVTSTQSLSSSYFTMYGLQFLEGRDWNGKATTTDTASSIYSIIASSFSDISVSSSASTVSMTYNVYVATANSPITTSVSSLTVSGMSGELESRPLLVNNLISFSLANADTVIYATATWPGAGGNYTLSSTSPTYIVCLGMSGGSNSLIDYGNHTIYGTTTYYLAEPFYYTKTAGTSPQGLVSGTTYYIIPKTATTYQLATSSSNAVSSNYIVILSTTSDRIGSSTYSLTPIPFTGSAYLSWQYSNDGTNFASYSVVNSTITSATTNNTTNLWDFSNFNYRYLRAKFLGPTWGAIKMLITGNGKKVAP